MKTHPLRSFWILHVLAVALVASSASASGLNMIFTNTGSVYSPTNTWITIQRGQAPSNPVTPDYVPAVTYGTNQLVWNSYTTFTTNVPSPGVTNISTNVGNLFAESVLLADINAAGGLKWISNAPSAVIWVSYGSALSVSNYSLSAPSISNPTDPNYNTPYSAFELTYYGNNSNDQGDITAINYFTAPTRITAFSGTDATGTQIGKSAGINPTTATTAAMLADFQQITGGNPNTLLTNASGQVTRVIGPTQFGAGHADASDFGSYTNMGNYLSSLTTTTTVFSNQSGYNTVVTPGTNVAYTNANVTFVLTNQVSSTTNGIAFEATGDITVKTIGYAVGGAPISTNTQIYTGIVFSVTPGTNEANLAAAFTYYGDYSPGTNISLGGAGWISFSNFMTTGGYVDGGGHPAATIVYAQIPGEISTGYDAGLAGSTNIVDQYPGIPLGELPSGDWWKLTNVTLFSDIQSTNGYYNQYADIIYKYSSNSVYGMTYSDRFDYASPYVSAAPTVGSWLVELGDPLHAVPEPAMAMGAIVFFIGFAAYKSRTRRKKA